jgi:glycosyltransferase involved in cell wall biosynthesis
MNSPRAIADAEVVVADQVRTQCVPVWFRVASFPDRTAGNPHLDLFFSGLGAHGIALTGRFEPHPRWIRKNATAVDAIHLHWPEKIWRGKTRGRLHGAVRALTLARYRAVFRFALTLKAAKKAGIKRIWTVHNIEPHEGASWLDRLGYRIAARNIDLAICYSHAAVQQVRDRYNPAGETVAMAHGNYAGIYPEPRDRRSVLREFGLDPDVPLVSCIGIIRPYKGLDLACQAVRSLQGAVQLAICGAPHSSGDTAAIEAEMRTVRGVLVARALNDQEFSDLIGASEAVLLPYRKITGSGSLLAAWTLGRGVIASDLPLFREMLAQEPASGDLFRPEDSRSLAESITRYLNIAPHVREAAALRTAQSYSWDQTVKPVVEVMQRWQTQ